MPVKMPDMDVDLRFFRDRNYERMQCPSCGCYYWGIKGKHQRCGDTPCVEYSFIGAPKTRHRFDMASMRETYLSFFEKRGHTRVARYPVIARWRDDVFLVNASIYDFQPHVTSGQVPPPANPLTISQPCIRLTDLDSVGRSGRHLSNFEMMAHHAFNSESKKVYWKEECTAYCHELLADTLSIPEEEITYKENPWMGGGNAGMALEVMVAGLELATLVFMNLKLDPKGDVELEGDRFGPMPLSVVDTGYGLERFVWVSQGTPTIYDAIYPDVLNEFFGISGVRPPSESAHPEVMAEHARLAGMMSVSTTSKLMEQRKGLVKRLGERGIRLTLEELMAMLVPLENVFALADHCRCILLMLSDGIVPSNVKAGYLARLVIRKALRTMEELKLEANLADLVLLHLKTTQGIVKLGESEAVLRTMLDLEVKRYRETTEKGARMVRRIAKESKGVISVDKLIELYDTHGIHPTVVQAAALAEGIGLEVPDAFSALVASRHAAEKKEAVATLELPPEIPQTRALYYEHPTMRHCTAKVTHVRLEGNGVTGQQGHEQVVLDQSPFYPEGGGQHADKGSIENAGRTAHIEDIQKYDGRILITLEHPLGLKVGDEVRCAVDWRTRMALSRHHTATHIIIGSARKVLGPHVWQAGAEKSEKGAHVDVSHYDRVTLDQLHEIEREANEIVAANLPVEHLSLPREEAEKRFGFMLYQGGAPAGPTIRVIRVGDFDTEACGGTHTSTSGEVGLIKITRAERIQDGVVRLEYSASMAALHHIQIMERIVHESSQELSVQPDQLPKTVKRFFEEWKSLKKDVEALRARAAKEMASSLRRDAERIGGYGLVHIKTELDIDLARLLSVAITGAEPKFVCVIPSSASGNLILSSGKEVALNLGDVARDVAKEFGGSGGGKGNFAQIGNLASEPGQATHRTDMAASRAAELIRALLAQK